MFSFKGERSVQPLLSAWTHSWRCRRGKLGFPKSIWWWSIRTTKNRDEDEVDYHHHAWWWERQWSSDPSYMTITLLALGALSSVQRCSIHPSNSTLIKMTLWWAVKESKSRWGYGVWKPTSSWRWTRRECWWPSNIIILSELVNVKYHHCIRTGQCLATFLFFFHSPMQQVYIVQNKNFHSLPLTFYCNLLCCFIQTSMVILIVGWCGWWDGRRHRFYWAKAWPIYCLSLQVLKYILHYILTVWVLLVYFKVWPPWLP